MSPVLPAMDPLIEEALRVVKGVPQSHQRSDEESAPDPEEALCALLTKAGHLVWMESSLETADQIDVMELGTNYSCKKCDLVFSSDDYLKRHAEKEHEQGLYVPTIVLYIKTPFEPYMGH